MPTESIENYLKTIFLLEEKSANEARITTKQIADSLGFTQASVSGMLQSLAEDSFVTYEKYKGVRLTEKGRLSALSVLRKHRLIEMLLVELFQYSWDEVHEEAENLEHAVSDQLAKRIDEYLGFPSYDPHGDPIPTHEGILPNRVTFSLSKVAPGTTVQLARVMTNSSDLLRFLQTNSIHIGSTLLVQSVQGIDGLMEVIVDNEHTLSLSESTATALHVIHYFEEDVEDDL